MAGAVSQTTLIRLITSAEDDPDSVVNQVLGGPRLDNRVTEALDGVQRPPTAGPNPFDLPRRRGSATGPEARIGDPSTSGGGQVTLDGVGVGSRGVRGGVVPGDPPEPPRGGCNPAAIGIEVGRRVGALRMCYEPALKRLPDLAGKVVVRFSVGGDGRVEELDVEEDTLGDAAVVGCVARVLRAVRFPPAGVACTVEYPFVFAPVH